MKTYSKKLIVVAGLVLFGVLVILSLPSKEPTYKGRRLSQWVEDYGREWASAPGTNIVAKQSEEALQHFGTNAVPYLLEWMNFQFPRYWSSTNHFVQFFKNKKFIFEPVARKKFRADGAMRTFKLLGPRADCAVGELTIMVTHLKSNQDQSAAMALTYLGPKAVPGLIAAITNQQIQSRYVQIVALRELGTNARPALPMLLECLKKDPDPLARSAVCSALERLQVDPAQIVPALTDALADPDVMVRATALQILARLGKNARSAGPVILKSLTDQSDYVRHWATNALRSIAPEMAPQINP